MKRKLLLFLFVLFSFSRINAQQTAAANNFSLKGKLTGRTSGPMILSYINKAGKYISDTTQVKNGVFAFNGAIEGPIDAMLTGVTKTRSSDDPNLAQIFLSPAQMEISLAENNFKNCKMHGSAMQDDMNTLNGVKTNNIKAEYEIGLELKTIEEAGAGGKETKDLKAKRDSVYHIYLGYRAQDRQIEYRFISTHPNSYLSPYLMDYYFGRRELSLDSAQLFFNTFSPAVKNGVAGTEINNAIIARKASAPGQVAPAFVKTDIDGKELDLTSFKGKDYVLLDFWASWCVPCREETPRLKQLYNKFHRGGLEIISISWDSKEKDWKDAISKDSTGMWRHVLANMYLPNDNSMRGKYAIAGIPSYVLIDKKGVIVGRYRGGDDEGSTDDLEKKLSELIDTKK